MTDTAPTATPQPPCPSCATPMEWGRIALWEHTRFTELRWTDAELQRWVRIRKPADSHLVMRADTDAASLGTWRCPGCGTIVIPPPQA